jgi:hypothetical protein
VPRLGPARLTLALAGVVLAVAAAPAHASTPEEEELAQKHAPVLRLVAQEEDCGYGEPFEPLDVDVLLPSTDVVLRGPWDTVNVAKIAPAAGDLASGRPGYHLDFPGDALEPGCDYDRWSKRIAAGTRPTTYARLVTEPAYASRLVLQYWFFYAYNDFNNKHEGDWEMIQLVFDVGTAAEALEAAPVSVGYSQHEGAERADWGEDKLELAGGTHPVVYPAAGSHANYFGPELYLGRSAAQGVGCDDTSGPSREVRPTVALVPTAEPDYLRAFPWLAFAGSWGERHPAFYNGPTGPSQKSQWTAPITWSEEAWRDSAFAIPAGGSLGTSATDFFCSAVAAGSDLLTRATRNPLPTLLALAGLLALALWGISRTDWDSRALRLARRRAWGQLVTAARRMYGSRFLLFVGIGFLFLPLSLLIALLQYICFRLLFLSPLVDSAGESNAVVGLNVFGFGLVFTALGLGIVQAVTARAMTELDAGGRPTPLRAYRRVLARVPTIVGGTVVVLILLDLTVVGIPFSIWLLVRWSLLAQVVELEGCSVLGSLRRSSELVSGHWWRVASISVVTTGLALLLGPFLGALLLLVSDASFDVVNVVAGLVYTVTLPFAAIATTYVYYDLLVRDRLAEADRATGGVLPAEI